MVNILLVKFRSKFLMNKNIILVILLLNCASNLQANQATFSALLASLFEKPKRHGNWPPTNKPVWCQDAANQDVAKKERLARFKVEIEKRELERELLAFPFNGGILSDNKISLPGHYERIVAGKHPDFDHVKFQELKRRYLDDVNKEIDDFLESVGVDKSDLNLDDQEKISEAQYLYKFNDFFDKESEQAITGRNFVCENNTDPRICSRIVNILERCGVNTDHVVIRSKQKMPYYSAAAVYGSVFKQGEHVLCINDVYTDDKVMSKSDRLRNHEGKEILYRQHFETVITHEAAHILYQDSLCERLFVLSKLKQVAEGKITREKAVEQHIKQRKLIEKRADIYSVFNNSNPIGKAIFDYQAGTDQYEHFSKPEWNDLIKDLASCYKGRLNSIVMGKVATIEHVLD